MKRILKQAIVFVLVFSMLVQSFVIDAYAAGTVSSNDMNHKTSIEKTTNESVDTNESKEEDIDINDWQQISNWFMEECNNDFNILAAKNQEWWDNLLPNERIAAEMYGKFVVEKSPEEHYTFENLDEVIKKIESGIEIESFFKDSRFAALELDDLYVLRENKYTLDDLALFMEAQYQPELYESELYDQYASYQEGELELSETEASRLESLNEMALKIMPMDYYGIDLLFAPANGEQYATMKVSSTGFGAGYNTTFGEHGTIYKLIIGGKSGFCLTYGKSARTGFMYGDASIGSGRIGWIIKNYAGAGSKTFVAAQIVIWCLQRNITSEAQVAALISTMIYNSASQEEVSAVINEGRSILNGSSGQSSTYYELEGPSGSQVGGIAEPPVYSIYNDGSSGGDSGDGGNGGEDPIIPEPEAPDPEYDTYSDDITVSYNVQVSKKDVDAGVGLAGAVIEVYENGSKVATLTTNSSGVATWSTSRSDSASAEYCTNYDELDDDGRDEVEDRGCYESEDDARDAVEDELDDFADRTYTYSAKEITAPYGYYNNDKYTSKSDTIAGNETAYFDFSDKEQLAELTIYKKGEVLMGATVTNDGVTFKYEVKPLANAVYSVYAADTIKTGYGSTVYNRGDLVKSGLTTGADGKVKLGNLHLGKYTVKETKPPHGYILNNAEKSVEFTYAGQDVLIVYDTTEYQNIRQKAQLSLLKQDADTKNPLDGAVYGLYANSDIKDYKGNKIVNKGTLIEKVTTPVNGKSTFKADIPIDFDYVVKEITAPFGYYNNESPYPFSFRYTNMNEAVVKFNNTFENDRVLGSVNLIKYDVESESDITQGNVEHLDGAVYGIYAAEDIIHADGATGVINKKDNLIATAMVEGNEKITFADLELGKYYIKELTPPDGYMLDETVYKVTFSYQGQYIKVVERDETAADDKNGLTVDDSDVSHDIYSGDYVIKQGVQFIKTSDNNYGTDLELIEGAGFSIYLISDLSGVEDGSLTPVNGSWGADDVMTFYDYDFTGEPKATLYKRSIETWTTGDTKWLKSLGGNLYEVKEMFTDADGHIETPELPFGTYVIVETTTPEDYVRAKPFVVHISQDGGVLYTDATKQTVEKTYSEEDNIRYGDRLATKVREGRALQKQKIINNAVTESYLRVVKADEEFLEAPGTYIKAEEVVRGTVLKEDAKYRVKCLSVDKSKNSLTSLNWKYDAEGYLTYYSPVLKGSLGTEENPFTTSFLKKNGKIIDSYITLPQKLPVGTYALIEREAPDGYVLNGSEQKVRDTSSERVNGYEIVNDVKASVTFTISNGSVFPDGQMGTNKYALTDSQGNLIVTVLQKNQEQKGIIEIYKHGEQLASVEISKNNELIFRYEDAPVEGAKFNIVAAEDIYTQELDKELLFQYGVNVDDYLIHKEGDVVATITTDRNGWGYTSGLYIGKYKIVETIAGNGFVLNTTQEEFEITKQNQKVNFDIQSSDYKNERQKVQIDIIKKDSETKELLEGAVYGIYAEEDIYTNVEFDSTLNKWVVRNTPEIIVEKGTLVVTGITGKDGKLQFSDKIPLGKYYIREMKAPSGYFMSEEEVFVDASYAGNKGGQNVDVQFHTVTFENDITKTYFNKVDVTNGKALEGAALAVYEVSVDEKYNTILIDTWVSDAENVHLIKGLAFEKLYLLRETKPADGYVTAEEILFKILEKKNMVEIYFYAGKEWVKTNTNILAMKDDVTKLEISKKDITTGEELPGATLEIYDADEKLVTSWVSTTTPYYIEKLPLGKYTLVEKLAPKGYSYAENVTFEIKDVKEIQKVEMLDDTQKVDVEKSTVDKVKPGEILKYQIDEVKNCTDEILENFTLTDILPGDVCLIELWTGTYNQKETYFVEYRTNLQAEWRIWEENLTTTENYQLQPPETLEENEFLTAFRFCYGTVKGKFEKITAPTYQVLVPMNSTQLLKNKITLSAVLYGEIISDQDETDTLVEILKEEPEENVEKPSSTGKTEEKDVTETGIYETEITEEIANTGDSAEIIKWLLMFCSSVIFGIMIYLEEKKRRKL